MGQGDVILDVSRAHLPLMAETLYALLSNNTTLQIMD